MALSHVEAENRSEILRHVPVGTAASTAQSILEANGFECSREADENGEYLYGDLHEAKNAFVTERWQVKLQIATEAVTSIEVSHGRIGL